MTIPFLDIQKLKADIQAEIDPNDSLSILNYPDERLFNKAERSAYSPEHRLAALRMFALHYRTADCAALAAAQLSFEKPLAITVIDFSPEKNQPLCLINPTLSNPEGEHASPEGCMSVYPESVHASVKRAARIHVEAHDLYGNPIAFDADEFMAKCIQHEVDHLHGTLYIEHLGPLRRDRVNKQIKQAIKTRKTDKES